MPSPPTTREELGEAYFASLPFRPYPIQEEALLAWFTTEQGVLVCAPTGMGKTLIAEGALYEALATNKTAYYTTPLIALTEQKFYEIQEAAVRWGFNAGDVGLATGNRRVNPHARIQVVVAEILLNRLLNPGEGGGFDFDHVATVVMDEFHSFSDADRGIVWELSLSMLPRHVRLLLLSATVGNSAEFVAWLKRAHGRVVELVEGTERKVPLSFHYVEDALLGEHMQYMAEGDTAMRRTPALVFCFNREECWTVAEQLKGLKLLGEEQRGPLLDEVNRLDWSSGVGPKLKQMMQRGVGVHHAGMLPKYRRVVEDLYVRKLLAVCVCTETLAAGINLPARSVVLTTLLKGPFGKKKVVDASTAHQIFGRAGRPQFDTEGHVYALAHEDDVKILRWKEKYDQIPEDTRDPGLIKAKKALKKKRPTRRDTEQYWVVEQFDKLREAPPGKLYSKGHMPWRLLAYLLQKSPEVDRIRTVIRKRLMDDPRIEQDLAELDKRLITLWAGEFVDLEPPPPEPKPSLQSKVNDVEEFQAQQQAAEEAPPPATGGLFGNLMPDLLAKSGGGPQSASKSNKKPTAKSPAKPDEPKVEYRPKLAKPTPRLEQLLAFRSIHPLYGAFLLEHLGIADRFERIQALESVLEVPRPLWKTLRIPYDIPPGPLAAELDPMLIQLGFIAAPIPKSPEEEEAQDEEPGFDTPPVAAKLKMLFDATYPQVNDLNVHPVWAAGELLRFGGDFDKYVRTNDLTKQEGIVFRHCLRMILLCGEFAQVCPQNVEHDVWQAEMRDIAEQLTDACRKVDPASTDETIERAGAGDIVS
jgi:superfamily II DNA/RNA helicase